MASKFTADNRNATITVNGKGPFIVTRMDLNETVSIGSEMKVEFLSDKILQSTDLGQEVNVLYKIDGKDNKVNFYLIGTNINYVGFSVTTNMNQYEIIAQDPLSILKFDSSYRVFQKKTTKAIINEVCQKAGIDKWIKFSVNGEGKNRDYCLQFNESSYDFIARLCAQEGWHFHSTHEKAVEVVIADTNNVFKDCKEKKLSYLNPTSSVLNCVNSWEGNLNIGTNSVSLQDFAFKNGQTYNNKADSSFKHSLTLLRNGYAADTKDKSEITDFSKGMLAGLDCEKEMFKSSSKLITLANGLKFSLENHPEKSFNQEYIIVSIEHHLVLGDTSTEIEYHNSFSCIPSKVEYKPQMLPKPKFAGTLTATVTGPSDKEIFTDDKGNVKVLIHFDGETKADENSSIWIPVCQSVAANGYGNVFLPRVGTTVIISFLNADIDKPVVLSSLYTENEKLPFSSSSQQGIKTHSFPNADANACNELRFDDQKDQEEIYIHAQKDMKVEIENDSTTTLKGNKIVTIEKKYSTSAKEEVEHKTEKTYAINSKDMFSITTDADYENVTKGKNIITVTGDIEESTKGNYKLDAKSNATINGDKIEITGKSKIVLKVGSSSIEISSSGIEIKASKVKINGSQGVDIEGMKISAKGSTGVDIQGMNVNVKADVGANVKGTMVELSGSTMATVKGGAMLKASGGIAMIN